MLSLWVDSYRPKNLDSLTYHQEVNETLRQLSKTSDFPHIIFYGPQGAGKKTRAISFIQAVFGVSSLPLSKQQRTIKLQGSSKIIEFTILTSNYHIQITPSDNAYDDRHIIQNTVKSIASSKNVNQKGQFKILIINEADRLTKQAQGSLRRTMEKYMSDCRMVLICNNLHKLIMPIRSRCINLRVPSPSNQAISQTLINIAKDHDMQLTEDMLGKILKNSKRNTREAICQLQCLRYTKRPDSDILHPYMAETRSICKLIFQEQSPMQIQKIRGILYDLLVNCVQPQNILKLVIDQIVESRKIKDELLKNLIHKSAQIQQTMSQGSKAIMHLQCFVAHAMEAFMHTKQSM